ncbi:GGDEF domain-containing protein [Acidovorax sp. BLS4]|uniref:GGDEF domain-containing protein n=1 Tax=Acidovorax sp. BLS4 TaxID=3273430 RepID=UPI00355C7537
MTCWEVIDIAGIIKKKCTLARLGGDEFGILLENCPAPVAEKIAESLRHTVQSLHFVWKGRPFVTTVSIGLVHITHAPTTLETSLRAADMACYMANGPRDYAPLSERPSLAY